MSDQGFEEKDLGAQDSTVSAGDKPADTRIAPGVTEQDHTESEAGDAPVAQPKKRQLTSRTIGAIAACAIALVAVLAGVGYAAGLFGSAQTSEQATQQQTQEQSASASSTSAKQSSGQSENSQDGGDKTSSAEDGKAKDENSSTDSSQEQSEGSSSEQASQSDASSGGSGAGTSGSAASNASDGSGSSASTSTPAYQEPEPEPAPAPAPSTISVYISIDSSRAQSYGLGGFSYGSTVVLPQGATVYDALCATGASISDSSYYVSAINGLAEKQCGNGSGWTYAVNGSFPGKACGRYTLSGGESISWIYSTEKNPTMAK